MINLDYTTTLDPYEIDERKGRLKLKQDYESSPYPIDSYFTPGKYDNIDNFATAHTPYGDLTYASEVKNREIPLDLYANGGYILEEVKYNALMEAHDSSGYTPLYINYFNDGRIVWDITTIQNVENRWIMKWCTQTTATNYGNRVLKKVLLLDQKEGKVRRTITE